MNSRVFKSGTARSVNSLTLAQRKSGLVAASTYRLGLEEMDDPIVVVLARLTTRGAGGPRFVATLTCHFGGGVALHA